MIFRARSFLLPRFLPCFTWLRPAWTCRSSRRPAKKPNAHVAILRRENQPVVIVQLNLVRRVIFRSPRRVSIPQRDDCSRRPSVFAYPDATFHSRVYAESQLYAFRRAFAFRELWSGGHSKSSRPSIQPSMYSTGGICSSRISFVTCTASNGRPKTHL